MTYSGTSMALKAGLAEIFSHLAWIFCAMIDLPSKVRLMFLPSLYRSPPCVRSPHGTCDLTCPHQGCPSVCWVRVWAVCPCVRSRNKVSLHHSLIMMQIYSWGLWLLEGLPGIRHCWIMTHGCRAGRLSCPNTQAAAGQEI